MNSKVKIIGLAGPAGVGKSTVARSISKITGGEIFSFADAIRLGLYVMGFPVDVKQKERPVLGDLSSRDLMKKLGMWGRDLDEGFWCSRVMDRIDRGVTHLAIIDDVRFDNEAEAIRARGGSVFQLSRGGVDFAGDHPTECGLYSASIDHRIDVGTPEEAALEIISAA